MAFKWKLINITIKIQNMLLNVFFLIISISTSLPSSSVVDRVCRKIYFCGMPFTCYCHLLWVNLIINFLYIISPFFHSGAAFTRFQTLRLTKIFPETLADTILSYGSCQFPTLGFIIERYKAIENFIPEGFWKLKGECLAFYFMTP